MSAQGVWASQPLQWFVIPTGFAEATATKQERFWGWSSGWYGEAEVIAGNVTGNGTVEIRAESASGVMTGSIQLRVVSGIQVESRVDPSPYAVGTQIAPILKVSWSGLGTSWLPQGLVWSAVDPLPGGGLTNLDPYSSLGGVMINAPTVPGTYQLKAVSIADPTASGTYTFTVR